MHAKHMHMAGMRIQERMQAHAWPEHTYKHARATTPKQSLHTFSPTFMQCEPAHLVAPRQGIDRPNLCRQSQCYCTCTAHEHNIFSSVWRAVPCLALANKVHQHHTANHSSSVLGLSLAASSPLVATHLLQSCREVIYKYTCHDAQSHAWV